MERFSCRMSPLTFAVLASDTDFDLIWPVTLPCTERVGDDFAINVCCLADDQDIRSDITDNMAICCISPLYEDHL